MYSTNCPWSDPGVSTRPRPRRLGTNITSIRSNESKAAKPDVTENTDIWNESNEREAENRGNEDGSNINRDADDEQSKNDRNLSGGQNESTEEP